MEEIKETQNQALSKPAIDAEILKSARVAKDYEQNLAEAIKNSSTSKKVRTSEARWYALHVFNGYETMVKTSLEEQVIENYNLQDRVFEITIPMESVIEEKKGKRKVVEQKMMPCYVLVKMIYGDDLWHAITRTRGITGFVGPRGRPEPLSEKEVARLRLDAVKIDVDIKVGDKVEILEGAVAGTIGEITSVDLVNQKVHVSINMFGRPMDVELDFIQIRTI